MRLVSAYYDDEGPFMHSGLFTSSISSDSPNDLRKNDALVVWGGEDISTSLYNHVNTGYTHAPHTPSKRDAIEWALMQRAKDMGLPIIGVCRGAQMLCALAGGYLIQDVDNHAGTHIVETPDGMFVTNSIHHQMQYPFEVEHELLGWTKVRGKRHIVTGVEGETRSITQALEKEPEYVYYPAVKGFAIQWHPEMMRDDCEATKYVFSTMKERL